MTEIKNIVFTNRLSFIKQIPCFINHLLPLKLKFAPETFVIFIDKKQKGEISLEKISTSKTRFKITKLILEEYSAAQQLTNYAISRYRAMGADSFCAVVGEDQADLLNVFINELNFRKCGYEYLYKMHESNSNFSMFLKTMKKEDIKDVCNFYNESINSFNRFLFGRENYQLVHNPCKQYVFFDDKKNVLGYFEVASKNNFDFYISFAIDCAYNVYLLDAIKFIYSKIKRKHKNFNLYIKVKDFFMNSKELIAILNENNVEFVSKSQILAKDFYKEIKENNLLQNAKIIFNDPTTA